MRLSKLMSRRGICSRREADRFIEQGLVQVDGAAVTTLGSRVFAHQTITLAAAAHRQQHRLATVLLNKPVGYVSGTPEKGYRAAVLLVTTARRWPVRLESGDEADKSTESAESSDRKPVESAALAESAHRTPNRHGLAPAGRLDIDSMGLLVFTQDGRIARHLISPESRIEKEYWVRVTGTITPQKLALLRHGIALDDKPLRPAKIEQLPGHGRLKFTLTEGRKRQIRRMCEHVELRVTRLTRTRIGAIELGTLASGQWRFLQPHESF